MISRRDLLKRAAALPFLGAQASKALADEPPVLQSPAAPLPTLFAMRHPLEGGPMPEPPIVDDEYSIIHRFLPTKSYRVSEGDTYIFLSPDAVHEVRRGVIRKVSEP